MVMINSLLNCNLLLPKFIGLVEEKTSKQKQYLLAKDYLSTGRMEQLNLKP